jgi:hypothetical protein
MEWRNVKEAKGVSKNTANEDAAEEAMAWMHGVMRKKAD